MAELVLTQKMRDSSGRFIVGHPSTCFGFSDEVKKVLSEKAKGRTFSNETRQKIRESLTGRKASPETKKLLSELRIGKKRPMSVRIKLRIANLGEKCNFWKGGVSKENDKQRHSLEHKKWREDVFERDNFTCQKCLIRGGHLIPHHIKNFAQHEELRFDVNNGITLHWECHNIFHKLFGQLNNNRDQIRIFTEAQNV